MKKDKSRLERQAKSIPSNCTALNCKPYMLNQWHLSLSSAFCSKPCIYRAVPNKQHRPWASVFQRSLLCLLTNCPLHGCCVELLNCKFVSVLALCNSFKCRKSIYVCCVRVFRSFLFYFLISSCSYFAGSWELFASPFFSYINFWDSFALWRINHCSNKCCYCLKSSGSKYLWREVYLFKCDSSLWSV